MKLSKDGKPSFLILSKNGKLRPVNEFFAELRIPVLEKLSLEAAYRIGDYSTVGTVDTWMAWVLSNGRLHVTDASNAGVQIDLFDGDGSGRPLGVAETDTAVLLPPLDDGLLPTLGVATAEPHAVADPDADLGEPRVGRPGHVAAFTRAARTEPGAAAFPPTWNS